MRKTILISAVFINFLLLVMPAVNARPQCFSLQNEGLHNQFEASRVGRGCEPDFPPIPNPTPTPPSPPTNPTLPSTNPDGSYTTTQGGATLTYYTSDGSRVVDEPIMLVEGYDPVNAFSSAFYYAQLPDDFKAWLKTEGKDLVILNFNNYQLDLKILANQFKSNLLHLNRTKTGGHPTAVIGYSAGGLIARWGLKTMENQGIDHDVSVYISYDTPHRGATIPFSIIDGISDLKRKIPSRWEPAELKLLHRTLNTASAQQLLIGGSSSFLREIETLGYPNKLARFAVANGSSTGTNINLPVGEIVFDYKAEISQVNNEYQTLKQEPHSPCSYPCDIVRNHDYDRSPGGTRDSFKQYWEALERADATTSARKFDLDVYYKNTTLTSHSFVNTLSALDIKNFDIHSPVTQTMENYGPFDGYAHNLTNTPHDTFDEDFANSGNAIINHWLNQYHVPNATIPPRADKKVSMGTVSGTRSEWLVKGTNFIYWSSVPGATHYEVLQRSYTGDYFRLKTTTNTVTRVNVRAYSSIAVRACNSDQCGYSGFTQAYYRPNVRPY